MHHDVSREASSLNSLVEPQRVIHLRLPPVIKLRPHMDVSSMLKLQYVLFAVIGRASSPYEA